MPPKIVFTKEQIIESAFAIFKEEGIGSLSVRKLAASLNSSTAPIYTSFGNIEDIKKALLDKALNLLLSYTEREFTHDTFLNIGVGMLEFARDYKKIYRTLFLESNEYHYIFQEFNGRNLVQMQKEKSLHIFEEEELKTMLDKLCTYTHGLAAFLCAGMLENDTKEYFIGTLLEMGGDVIGAAAYKKGLAEKYFMCYGEEVCQDEKRNDS